MRRCAFVLSGLALGALGRGEAAAGGLSRVNTISPRAVGLGGAFGAVADDPSALHFNPAGLAGIYGRLVSIGIEYLNSNRTYTPTGEDGERLPAQSPNSVSTVVPSIGATFRTKEDGSWSRFAFALGLWNSYGGQVSYDRLDDAQAPALNETREVLLEMVGGVGYEASEYVSLGLALRLGIGLFHVDATNRPVTSDMSSVGFGVGLTGGVILSNGVSSSRAGSARIGFTYRTPMTVATSGSATMDLSGGSTDVDMDHDQRWPQSAAVAVAWRPAARLLLAAQADWTDWERINELTVEFPDRPELDQTFEMDWDSNYSLRLGTSVILTPSVEVSAGGSYDTRAVSKRTMERHNLDSDKFTADAGVAVAVTERMKVLGAVDVILSSPVEVRNNTAEAREAGWIEWANKAPGTHEGRLITIELAAQYVF